VSPTPPATPPPDDTDIFARLVGWLSRRVNDIIRIFLDTEGAGVALSDLGWEGKPPVVPPELITRLDAGTDPNLQETETFSQVLVAFGALVEATVSANPELSPTAAAELLADFLDMAIATSLREDASAVWAVMRILDLLVDDAAQLGNLGQLFSDPDDYVVALGGRIAPSLTGEFGGPPYVQRYAGYSLLLAAAGIALAYLAKPSPNAGPDDWLDPHGHNVDAFSIDVLYGWTPVDPVQLDPTSPLNPYPHLMEVLPRILTVRADFQRAQSSSLPAGFRQQADLTIALVPAEHIPLPDTSDAHRFGVFFRLAGLTTIEIPLANKWQLTVTSPDAAAAEWALVHGGPGGFARVSTTGGYKASVAFERPADVSGSWVLGPPQGSHVEIQHARLALTIADDDQRGWLFDVGAHADHVIVNVELGNDAFIRAVLPPSLRLDTKLGLGVELGEHGRGFYLDGGVALVVDLPVDLPPVGLSVGSTSIVAVVVQGLHLRVGVSGADPGGDGASGASFAVAFTIDAAARIAGGVVTASVAGVGVEYSLTQVAASTTNGTNTAGHWQTKLDAVPPKGVGIAVKSGPVNGGGFIGYDPATGEYTGALQLQAKLFGTNFDLTALGMLDTQIPGHPDAWSLLLLLAITLHDKPVGGGLNLTGGGGIFGHNHAIDTDAIAAGLRTKALDAILFPPDPVTQAPHIFGVWRQTLPIVEGRTVVGLMAQLTWGVTISTIELAILLDFDGSSLEQVVLLVSLQLHAPTKDTPLIQGRFDAVGCLRFDPTDFLLQGVLIDGKIGRFPASGGIVLAARGGDDSAYLLSIGGFNPQFTPPAGIPTADRVRLDLGTSNNPRIRFEGYLAITSQTVQLGARIELHAAAGPLAVDGWFGFDGLADWAGSPQISLEIAAGLSLSFDGSPLMEVNIDVLVEGWDRWRVKGYVSLSLLFVSFSLPIDYHDGDPVPSALTTADPLELVRDALSRSDAWSAPPPTASAVVALRQRSGKVIAAHPLGVVSCSQRVVPLGLQVTHVGSQVLAAPATVDVTALVLGGGAATDVAPVTEQFSAGQFLDLSDAERLSRPSFEPMRSGMATGGSALDAGNAAVVATTYKTVAVDGATRTTSPKQPLAIAHADAVLRPPHPARPRPLPVQISLAPDTLRSIAGDGSAPDTASLAAQRADGGRLLDLAGVAGANA
jgi:uncharacterized protein DUF6603